MNKVCIALAALGFTTALTGAAWADKVCEAALTSRSVNGATLVLAKANAVVNWQFRAARAHPLAWANWSNAEARSYACVKRTNLIGLNIYWCKATARPCIFE